MLFPGGHAASICDNTICRVLEEEEEEDVLFTLCAFVCP
jgi:hypothetical protein